jgi:hypothetical protein
MPTAEGFATGVCFMSASEKPKISADFENRLGKAAENDFGAFAWSLSLPPANTSIFFILVCSEKSSSMRQQNRYFRLAQNPP